MKNARDREIYKKEIRRTGGGTLTAKQTKIANNLLYEDLASKLGVSAIGNTARFDSDADATLIAPSSARLRNAMKTVNPNETVISVEQTLHAQKDSASLTHAQDEATPPTASSTKRPRKRMNTEHLNQPVGDTLFDENQDISDSASVSTTHSTTDLTSAMSFQGN